MSDVGIWLGGLAFLAVLFIHVLFDIARGTFLRMWHEQGERRVVSLPVVRMCWFLFVFVTVFGMVVYLIWKIRWKKKKHSPVHPSGCEEAVKPSACSHSLHKVSPPRWGGYVRRLIWGIFWFFPLFFLFLFCIILFEEMGFLAAVIFSVAGIMGMPSSRGIYNAACGGFFFPLVCRNLPVLKHLPKEQRQVKFHGLYSAMQGKHLFEKTHNMLARVILSLTVYLLVAMVWEPHAEIYPWLMLISSEWVQDWVIALILSLVAFKFLIWDAAVAWLLYHRLKGMGAI